MNLFGIFEGLGIYDFTSKKLTEFPYLPDDIKVLYCKNNLLTKLPTLPSSLETLACGMNQLEELPELPGTLKELYCYGNKLSRLPILPDGLKILYCDINNFSDFTLILPLSLTTLSCRGTGLPYTNLVEYNEWLELNHPDVINSRKFNL